VGTAGLNQPDVPRVVQVSDSLGWSWRGAFRKPVLNLKRPESLKGSRSLVATPIVEVSVCVRQVGPKCFVVLEMLRARSLIAFQN